MKEIVLLYTPLRSHVFRGGRGGSLHCLPYRRITMYGYTIRRCLRMRQRVGTLCSEIERSVCCIFYGGRKRFATYWCSRFGRVIVQTYIFIYISFLPSTEDTTWRESHLPTPAPRSLLPGPSVTPHLPRRRSPACESSPHNASRLPPRHTS